MSVYASAHAVACIGYVQVFVCRNRTPDSLSALQTIVIGHMCCWQAVGRENDADIRSIRMISDLDILFRHFEV